MPLPADDFDESTPPPRRRPAGPPPPPWTDLPPGEPAADLFSQWGREGRVPAGAVLARFRGNLSDRPGLSGLVDAGGREIPAATRQRYRTAAVIVETTRAARWLYFVLTPPE